MLNLLIH